MRGRMPGSTVCDSILAKKTWNGPMETLPEVRATWLPEWLPRTFDTFELLPLSWSPFTESNRRPSPYHWGPINPTTRHFAERPGQKLHFSSVGSSSGRFEKDATSQIPPSQPSRRSSVRPVFRTARSPYLPADKHIARRRPGPLQVPRSATRHGWYLARDRPA